MKMITNPDWDTAAKRLEAFWEHEIIDRPCLQVYCDEQEPALDVRCDYESRWNDPASFLRTEKDCLRYRTHLGEAFPAFYPNWEGLSIMAGAGVKYDDRTIWVKPEVESVTELDLSGLTIQAEESAAEIIRLEKMAELGRDECFIGFPPMGNSGDSLAKLVGYCNFCFDLADNPEEVIRADDIIEQYWEEAYDAFTGAVGKYMGGTCGWLPAWHPRRSALIEFDLGALISPEMYKMFLPNLLKRTAHAERSIYHLDGPDALKHLDTILAQKEFDAIQWEPGAGGGSFVSWLPLMKQIQDAGKCLYVGFVGVEVDEARELLKELRPEGLLMPVKAHSVEEGQKFLDEVTKMY